MKGLIQFFKDRKEKKAKLRLQQDHEMEEVKRLSWEKEYHRMILYHDPTMQTLKLDNNPGSYENFYKDHKTMTIEDGKAAWYRLWNNGWKITGTNQRIETRKPL